MKNFSHRNRSVIFMDLGLFAHYKPHCLPQCSVVQEFSIMQRPCPAKAGYVLIAMILFMLPATAHADAATPLLWTAILHLMFGNAFIGVGEGCLINRVFHPKTKIYWTIPLMIGANYFSTACGLKFLPWVIQDHFDAQNNAVLFHLPHLLIIVAVLSYFLTLLAELPFFLWIFRKDRKGLIKSIAANLLAQTASYIVLIPIYLLSCIATGL